MTNEEIAALFYRFEDKLEQINNWGKLIEAYVKEGISRTDSLEKKIVESVRKSEERHKETSQRLDLLTSQDSDIKKELNKLKSRLETAEQDIRDLDIKITNVKRTSDHGDHLQEQSLVSAMHIQSKTIQEMKENQEASNKSRENEMRIQTQLLQKLVGWKDAWWFKGAVVLGAMLAAAAATLLSKCGH